MKIQDFHMSYEKQNKMASELEILFHEQISQYKNTNKLLEDFHLPTEHGMLSIMLVLEKEKTICDKTGLTQRSQEIATIMDYHDKLLSELQALKEDGIHLVADFISWLTYTAHRNEHLHWRQLDFINNYIAKDRPKLDNTIEILKKHIRKKHIID